jgi:hypothetical protein
MFGIFSPTTETPKCTRLFFGHIAYRHAQIIIRSSSANALSEPATIDQQRIKKKTITILLL